MQCFKQIGDVNISDIHINVEQCYAPETVECSIEIFCAIKRNRNCNKNAVQCCSEVLCVKKLLRSDV